MFVMENPSVAITAVPIRHKTVETPIKNRVNSRFLEKTLLVWCDDDYIT
jgi:hypothetical protein